MWFSNDISFLYILYNIDFQVYIKYSVIITGEYCPWQYRADIDVSHQQWTAKDEFD